MADARNNMCGMWSMTCTPSRHGTLLEGIRSAVGDKAEILYAKGSNVYYDAEMEKGAVGIRPLERGNDQQLLAEALRTAARADVIVAAVGECAEMSGESPSRTNLEIPDAQQDLLKALVKTGKPVVLLLFTGRPLILNWESEHIPSILNVWFGGSEDRGCRCRCSVWQSRPVRQADYYLPSFGRATSFVLQSFEHRTSGPGQPCFQPVCQQLSG